MTDKQEALGAGRKQEALSRSRPRQTSMNLFRAFDMIRSKQMNKEILPDKSGQKA